MNSNIKKLLDVAQNEIGYLEKASNDNLDCKTCNAGSANYTKYAKECFPELQGLSWCCMFVWWCFEKAFGKIMARNLIGEKTAKCSIMKERMINDGCKRIRIPEAEAGDIIFFNSGSGVNHIGIVLSVGNTIATIEGNTSRGTDNVVANGGGVFTRAYQKNNTRIDSIYRPQWDLMTDSKEVAKEPQKYNAEIIATNVNIRVGAGTEHRVLGMESKGYKFYKIGEDYDGSGKKWYNFMYKGKSAYIRYDFVKVD